MNGSAGELTQGVLAGSTKKIADGLMKIYFYPGTITNISPSTGAAAGSIRLTWTAPGADGNQRTASKYMVKYSTYPAAITDQDYFENTATLFKVAVPNAPGTSEILTITGLTPGTSYYVAIETRDADENQGELSNSTYTWAQVSVLAVDIENFNGDPNSYGFGAVTMSSAIVSTSTIRVTNTGTVPATWSLQAATATAGSPWVLTRGALATDVLRMSAVFEEARPDPSDYSTSQGNEDRMIVGDALATGTTFSVDGSSTGVSVPVGNYRHIWFLLETPLASNTTVQQSVQVTVTANNP